MEAESTRTFAWGPDRPPAVPWKWRPYWRCFPQAHRTPGVDPERPED